MLSFKSREKKRQVVVMEDAQTSDSGFNEPSPEFSIDSLREILQAWRQDEYRTIEEVLCPTHLPAPQFFYHFACQFCKKVCVDKSGNRCSSCKLVVYCCKEHQQRDWFSHKFFCNAVKQFCKNTGLRSVFADVKNQNRQNYLRLVHMKIAAVETILKRPLQSWEREMFLFPRVCHLCLSDNQKKLKSCADCFTVVYCSSEHQKTDLARHKGNDVDHMKLKNTYLMQKEMFDNHGLALYPWLNYLKRWKRFVPLPLQICLEKRHEADMKSHPLLLEALLSTDLTEFRNFLYNQNSQCSVAPWILTAFLFEDLSYPVSVLYALEQVHSAESLVLKSCKSLTVHIIVSDNSGELFGFSKWELLAHRLPTVKSLTLVFIGPELDHVPQQLNCADTPCSSCRNDGVSIQYKVFSGLYHTFTQQASFTEPDAVVAFSASFSTCDPVRAAAWNKVLPQLVRGTGAPLILTSYSDRESVEEVSYLLNAGKLKDVVQVRSGVNPAFSSRPLRDPGECEDDPACYHVNWNLSVVWRTQTQTQ